MSNQDSDSSKPVGRFARLMSAAQKSSEDSGFIRKDEPKTIGAGGGIRSRMTQGAVSKTKKSN